MSNNMILNSELKYEPEKSEPFSKPLLKIILHWGEKFVVTSDMVCGIYPDGLDKFIEKSSEILK